MPEGFMKSVKAQSIKGYIFLAIFGAFFLIPGLFMGAWQLSLISKSIKSKSWETVPAVVMSAELDRSRTSEGGTTYKAKGLYQYEWGGRKYESDSLFFSKSYDSDRKYHNSIVTQLRNSKRSNRTIEVKVNPKRPDQSVAFPALRPKMMMLMSVMSVLFSSVGGGIIWMTLWAKRAEKRELSRQHIYPGEPWRWKDNWQTPEVKSSSQASFYGALFFAAFWNLISWPITILSFDEIISDKNRIALVVFLFPIVGIGLAHWAFRSWQQWKKFGHTRFVAETYPSALGHALVGSVVMPTPPSGTKFHLKLNCIRKEESGSGKNRTTRDNILWQDEQFITSENSSSPEYRLPVFFKLPNDLPQSTMDDEDDHVVWRLTAEAETAKAKFDQSFDLPVFDPDQYSIKIPNSARIGAGTGYSTKEYKGDWRETGVMFADNADGKYYFFPAARHKKMATAITLMAIIFSAVGFAPLFSDMPWFFSIVFGLTGLGLLAWAVSLWLHKSALNISADGITFRRGIFGGKMQLYRPDDIKSIELESTMSSGDVKYYDIVAALKSGKKLRIANNLLGRRDVENLISKFKQEIGLA